MADKGHLGKTLAGAAIGVLFLYLAFRRVDIGQMKLALGAVSPPWALLTAGLTVCNLWLRGKRWQILLAHKKKIKVYPLFKITMIGFAASNLLPARLGEVVRGWLLGRKEQVGTSFALATIVLERIVDTVAILTLMAVFYGIVLVTGITLPGVFERGGPVIAVLLAGGLTALVFLRFRGGWVRSLAASLGGKFGRKARETLVSFSEGLDLIRSRRDALVIGVYSLLVWGTVFVMFHATLVGMGFSGVPPYASVIATFLVLVGVMIPSAPAYVGTIQFCCVLALEPFGVSRSAAVSYSLVYHFCTFIPITGLGLYYYWKEQVSFKDITAKRTDIS